MSKDEETAALRRLSRAAFGQTYRLEVMLAVADASDGLVTQTMLARHLGVSVSNVQKAVRSLLDCGLLTELPQGDQRSKFLLRNPSAAWEWAAEMQKMACVDPGTVDEPQSSGGCRGPALR